MSRIDLIRTIGGIITDVDVLRSKLPRSAEERLRLDNIRDQLDASQRQLVRSVIKENTPQFRRLGDSLTEVNIELQRTVSDANRSAETLATLVKAVGVVDKIVALIP